MGPDWLGGTTRGLTAVAEAWSGVLSAWEGLRVEADEYREIDEERVFVVHRWSGSAKASGMELEQISGRSATLFRVRDGKVTRLVAYRSVELALDDLGLPAEPRPDSGRRLR